MNFLILSPYHWDSTKPSGIANSVYYIAKSLSQSANVDILSSNVGISIPNISNHKNIKYSFYKILFSEKYLFSLNIFPLLINKIKKNDCLILNEYFTIKIFFILFINHFFYHKKIIFFPRGSLIRHLNFSKKKYLFDKVFLNSIKNVNHVFFTSEYEFKQSPFFNNSSILPNCYIPLQINNCKKKKYNNYFLYLNEISTPKGFDFLIESWKMFYKTNSDFQLVVIGHVNESYIQKFNMISNSFSNYNINYLGVIKGQEKDFFVSNALMTILTSYSENFSNIVIESLAYGVPVLATHGTPWNSLVEYQCGYYINHENDLFCNALQSFIDLNNNDKIQMKNNAINYFTKNFSFKIFSERLNSLIYNL